MVRHILVPLDGSQLAECVLPHVLTFAQVFETARVTFLRVVERPREPGLQQAIAPLQWHVRMAEAKQYLDQVASSLTGLYLRAGAVLAEGKAAERIVTYAEESGADLMVLSTHGQSGLSPWNISSVVQKIILRARIPTLLVRAHQPLEGKAQAVRYDRILAPVDGSQRAECVLPMVSALAGAFNSRVLLAHVVPRPAIPRHVPLTQEERDAERNIVELNQVEGDRYLQQLTTHLPGRVETHVLVSNDIPGALHDLAEEQEVQVVVLSAHGYTGTSRWPYGGTALNFIVYGATPLLIVQDISPSIEMERPVGEAIIEHKGH